MNDLVPLNAAALVNPRPARAYLEGLAATGRRSMQHNLVVIADMLTQGVCNLDTLPWHLIGYEHAKTVRTRLQEKYAPATVNQALSALRGVLREAWRMRLMDSDTYHRVVAIENVRGSTLPAGRDVDYGELIALANICQDDQRPQGARDGALLAVAFTAGLRVSELVALQLDDYNAETGELFIHTGKGHKQRKSYVAGGAKRAVDEWLAIRGIVSGPLFYAINKGGRLLLRGMSGQAVYDRFQQRAKQAGVKSFSPHDGRRTWIGDLLDKGVDAATISKLAGHASVTTTVRYDRRPERVKQDAISKLHWPWR